MTGGGGGYGGYGPPGVRGLSGVRGVLGVLGVSGYLTVSGVLMVRGDSIVSGVRGVLSDATLAGVSRDDTILDSISLVLGELCVATLDSVLSMLLADSVVRPDNVDIEGRDESATVLDSELKVFS